MDKQSILDGIKVEILREKRDMLVKAIRPQNHFDFLRSKSVLSQDDCEEISSETTTRRRASRMLDLMLNHGPSAYDWFCQSLLKERTQIHLLTMLNKEFENRKNNVAVLFENASRSTELPMVNPVTLPRPPVIPGTIQFRQRSVQDDSQA